MMYRGPFVTFPEVLLLFLFFDDFNIFLTVADSYNARIDSYNCRQQL